MDHLHFFPHGCSCLISSPAINDCLVNQFQELLKESPCFNQCKVKQTSLPFLLYLLGEGGEICTFISFSCNPLI